MREFDNTDKAVEAIDEAIESALYAAAVKIHGDAVMMAPVDTGNLRGSLSFSVSGSQAEGVSTPASSADGVGSAPPDTAVVGSNAHYAPYVEYGTYKMAAQPFLEPALRDNHDNIQRLMKEQFAKRLKELTE